MVKARSYCLMMDTCFQAWQQPEELANGLAADVGLLVQSIGRTLPPLPLCHFFPIENR